MARFLCNREKPEEDTDSLLLSVSIPSRLGKTPTSTWCGRFAMTALSLVVEEAAFRLFTEEFFRAEPLIRVLRREQAKLKF